MIKVVDIVYYHHSKLNTPEQVLEKHLPALGFSDFMSDPIQIQFVKHLDYEGIRKINGKVFAFFRSRNRFWWIPFKTNRFVKNQNPDIVIVEGLIFPLQLMQLRFLLGKKCRIVAQHHGERPYKGIKMFFQKMADRFIQVYLFTSNKNAEEWIKKRIIKDPDKCREVLESSTRFTRQDPSASQARLGFKGIYNFLWVGRLNSNKDPVTVLRAFNQFAVHTPDARLYMVFQEDDLREDLQTIIGQNKILENMVTLVGKVDHHELPYWFSAANFYISASHREGSGYALLEAMACGCIPVVTEIPSFEKITSNGKYGFLYPPGDVESLVVLLKILKHVNVEEERQKIEKYFRENLSFQRIAGSLTHILTYL